MSDDGEELEFGVAFRAGAGGQHDEGLGAVLGVQEFTVDVDAAEFGMHEGLVIVVTLGDFLPLPHADELGAAFLEFGLLG